MLIFFLKIRNFGKNLSNVQNVGQAQTQLINEKLDKIEMNARIQIGDKVYVKPPPTIMVPEYLEDIYQYLLATENKPNYRKTLLDKGLSDFKRMKVYQSIKRVQIELTLKNSTFNVAFDLFEKYVAYESRVCNKDLYTIMLTCVFIAGKYEEIYAPQLFQYSADPVVQNSILYYESLILMRLDFRVQNNNLNYWVNLYLTLMRPESQPSHRVQKYTQFLTDVMIIFNDFVPFKRSELARVILAFLEDLMGTKEMGLNWNITTRPTKDHEAYIILCYRIKEDSDRQNDKNTYEDTKDYRSTRDSLDNGIKWLKEIYRI